MMNWKKFKNFVEDNGVKDDTELAYEDMNYGGSDGEIDEFCIKIDLENNELRFESKYYQDVD